jgi:hypothetical protein
MARHVEKPELAAGTVESRTNAGRVSSAAAERCEVDDREAFGRARQRLRRRWHRYTLIIEAYRARQAEDSPTASS